MSIDEKLKFLQKQGLSLKFLANLCGIKSSLIYRWNSGNNTTLSKEKINILYTTIHQLYDLFINNEKAPASIHYENIANQKFNHLTALYPVGATKDGRMQWACQCDCGNPILKITTASCLKKGETVSCGCQRIKNGGKNLIDLTGKKFGKLTVIKRGADSLDNRVQWECKCDCGKICLVRSHDLLEKKVFSCGCLSSSYGENKIEELLKNKNIKYIKEYSFNDLLSPKQKKLRFDFAIFDNEDNLIKLIEFDGKQHFEEGHFNETEEDFSYRKLCDQLKDEYCLINNIELIRIPYTKIDLIKELL